MTAFYRGMPGEPEIWAYASNGTEGAFPGRSGMVAEMNPSGYWFAYIPQAGASYSGRYYEPSGEMHYIDVINVGDGTYQLRIDGGAWRQFHYANRWFDSQYFDAAGNPIDNASFAGVVGPPQALYYVEGAAPMGDAVPVPAPSPAPAPAGAPTTSSSNGDPAYAGESGMVARRNSSGYWVAYMPPVGAIYISSYGGNSIAVRNVGSGVYTLSLNGEVDDYLYDPKWSASKYFDAGGFAIPSFESANRSGDPVAAYHVKGVRARDGTVAPSPAPAPATTTIRPAPAPAPTGVVWTTPAPPPGVVTPGGTAAFPVTNPRPITPVTPAAVTPAPQPVSTAPFPETVAPETGNGGALKFAALAIAALTLLK